MLKVIHFLILTTFIVKSSLYGGTLFELIGVDKSVDNVAEELRTTISHARVEAKALIKEGNEVAKERLKQIDSIVRRTLKDVTALQNKTTEDITKILNQANKDIIEIETKLINDLNTLLWKTECSSKRIQLQDFKETLGSFGKFIGTHEIIISPPIIPTEEQKSFYCKIVSCSYEKEFAIKEPFGTTYIEIRNFMLQVVDKYATEDTPTHSIIDTYAYISSLALKTSCFYPGGSNRYIKEYVKYKTMAEDWNILNVEVTQ